MTTHPSLQPVPRPGPPVDTSGTSLYLVPTDEGTHVPIEFGTTAIVGLSAVGDGAPALDECVPAPRGWRRWARGGRG